jgi:hypothetical protein
MALFAPSFAEIFAERSRRFRAALFDDGQIHQVSPQPTALYEAAQNRLLILAGQTAKCRPKYFGRGFRLGHHGPFPSSFHMKPEL